MADGYGRNKISSQLSYIINVSAEPNIKTPKGPTAKPQSGYVENTIIYYGHLPI